MAMMRVKSSKSCNPRQNISSADMGPLLTSVCGSLTAPHSCKVERNREIVSLFTFIPVSICVGFDLL